MKVKIKKLTDDELGFFCIHQKKCKKCPLHTKYGCWNNVYADMLTFGEKEIEIMDVDYE